MDIARANEDLQQKIEEAYDACKKKKPQAMDSSSIPKVKKGAPIEKIKNLKLPAPDPKSIKINGIKWGTGSNKHKIAFARQDHLLGVVDTQKNIGIACSKANWTQCIAMHPTKDIVLSGGMDNATTMWSIEGGKLKEKKKIIEHDGYIASLCFTHNGDKYLSAGGDADSRHFDIEKATSITRFCGHEKDAQSLCFSASDTGHKLFATCSSDKTVRLWDVGSGKQTHKLTSTSELNACAMFPMERSLVAAGGVQDKTFLWDIRAMKLVSTYARNNMTTASLAFSSSGRHLYVGHDDGAIIQWDIWGSGENKEYANKIVAHTKMEGNSNNPDPSKSRVQNLTVGEDGLLASCGFDGNVTLWGPAKAQ